MVKKNAHDSQDGGPETGPQRNGEGTSSRRPAAGAGRKGGRPPKRTWMETHGRDLKFLGIFALLMTFYWGLTTTAPVKNYFFPVYLKANAVASAGILHLFGYEDMYRKGKSLISPRGSITVERGCDAVEPAALFVSAVLASPVLFESRLIAVVLGTIFIMLLNLFRIITLFLCAVHWRAAFDIMHLDVWQTAFIIFALVLWGVWAAWVTRKKRPKSADVTTH